MTRLLLLILFTLFMIGCSSKYKYDYTIHKPKVRYKPSLRALNKLNRQTIGHKYVWGAENAGCYDCSGLTYYTFGSMGVEIPRVAKEQYRVGTPIAKSQLRKGDLVFFDTSKYRSGRVTHVGIYLGNGKFQHASSAKKRVVVSSLNSPYYKKRYLGARRVYNFKEPKFRVRREYISFKPKQPQVMPKKEIKVATTNSYNLESVSSSSEPKYYILLHPSSNEASKIVTKLELSGLPSTLTQGGDTILVGPFSSRQKAMEIKYFNPTLLANAQIRSL